MQLVFIVIMIIISIDFGSALHAVPLKLWLYQIIIIDYYHNIDGAVY